MKAAPNGRVHGRMVLMLGVRSEAMPSRDLEGMREWCKILGVDADAAGAVYREASTAGLMRGRHVRAMQAAAIYVAARRAMNPVTIGRVACITGEPLKSVRRVVTVVSGGRLPPQDAMLYVEAGVHLLGLPPGTVADLDCIRTDLGAPMRAAIALFAASHACGLPHSIAEVADAVGVKVKTLRHYVRQGGIIKPKALPDTDE